MSDEAKRREAAMTELQRLIDGGKFRMSIPVENDRDSDTIIGAVVRDSRLLEAERDALRLTLRLEATRIISEAMNLIDDYAYYLEENLEMGKLQNVTMWLASVRTWMDRRKEEA